jgi:hypothetical protein
MRDGTRLSAAVHWPEGAPGNGSRYPAVFEYHPYRKDDRSAPRAYDHDYFAGHGYVSIRLDVRGSGSSEGVNTDEYMLVETQDGYDAIEWMASQPWCNGNVGMFGSSYGGFTSLQVASLRPPHLKAIVPIYATDDRYTDDCHYKGGAFKAYYDTGTYGTMMVALNALPPSPEAFPDTWRQMWRDRVHGNEPYMQVWLSQQTDGPYWRPGSLRGQYEKVAAATFIIGGWQDGYPNPPGRIYQNLTCTKKLLIGQWNHSRPDIAVPGPNIHYLNEMRRWFDLWLKHSDDGISKERPVTFFVQSHDRPDQSRKVSSGQWRTAKTWPPSGASVKRLYLAPGDTASAGRLTSRGTAKTGAASVEYDPAAGLQGGLWSGGLPFGLAGDQRPDEAVSLVYTSARLERPLTLCGMAKARLTVSSSAETACFVVKLADVAPDGSSALVSRGVLNGTRRSGMSSATPMTPGEKYALEIELDCSAWTFAAGHSVRLAVSGSDFPNSWPTPLHATLTVYAGMGQDSYVELPTVAEALPSPVPFLPPPAKSPTGATQEPHAWRVTEDVIAQRVTVTIHRGGRSPAPGGAWSQSSDDLTLSLSRKDPSDVRATGVHRARIEGASLGVAEVVATQEISSDREAFLWEVDLQVTHDGQPFASRKWQKKFKRELL